ncbi:MAG TPA: ABC transporter permease [Blastocatellia bacterium]|nr:ABC transporter permease [Blastocatellia bacterium]
MPEWKEEIRKQLLALKLEPTRENEIVEELAQHFESLYAELRADGATKEEARRAILQQLNQSELLPRELQRVERMVAQEPVVSGARRRNMFGDLQQDLRYGARMLVKNPAFTTIAVLTLALGIGVNAAIFSVVNAVLLQPLPYAKADELVQVIRTPGGKQRWPFSPGAYLDLKNRNTVFTGTAALSNKGWPANLTERGEPERLQGYAVSANLFPLLGVAATQGRTFYDEEDRPGENRVVVLSHALWQRRFDADPQIIGQALMLNGAAYTVVGVMPADFRFYTKTDLWTTLAFTAADENDDSGYLEVIGRRKSDVSPEQASAEIENIVRDYRNSNNLEMHALLTPPQQMLTEEVRPMLLLLFAAVGFVLLIACANIANLLLARGNVRRREMAIRSALGAGRFRVVRQLLAESLLLAFVGGAIGLLLANWAIKFIASGLPEYLIAANSRIAMLKIDSMALGFTFVLSLLTSMLFGLAPALQLSKINLNEALKEGGRTAGTRNHLRSALVVAEVALAMVLLVGAGLMVKSFWRLAHVNPGYEPAGVLTARIDPGANYKEFEQVTALYQGLLERVSTIPGVRSAGVINSLNASFSFSVDEHPPLPPEQRASAAINQVSADYFKAMGIPLRAGRFFTDRDVRGTTPVVIISETFAQQHFPNEDPIGKHLTCKISRAMPEMSYQIVGVVGGARYEALSYEPFPHMYYSYLQDNWWSMSLVVRTGSDDPISLTTPIRAELATIDKNQPIHSFKALEETVAQMVAPQRFTTMLLTGFAALAALLAAIGIYGVMSYSVTQRTREIGVRMALGAQAGDVMKTAMKQAVILVAVGVMTGLAASFALTRLISNLLFGVEATDPATLVAITLLLIGIALVACFIPARRATKVDPIVALRYE